MSNFAVLFPVTTDHHAVAKATLESLKNQTFSNWKCYLVGGGEAANALVQELNDARFEVTDEALTTFATLINAGAKREPEGYVLALPERVVLTPAALAEVNAHFLSHSDCACVYSSYDEVKPDGSVAHITIYPHEGAPHERFDFGFLKIYRSGHVAGVGGVRTDLVHAAEYDLDLKLADSKTLEVIPKSLYSVHLPESTEASSAGALHAPGKGKLGGFSYVFYPADLEKEITSVFEEMLRRRGAWIDHETVAVDYPTRPYQVLATVVIPVFNRAKYIGNAIDRVLDGTFQNFEVVVIDNGSSDGTQDVVREYVKKDRRVRLIEQLGDSISYALNCGIRAARGKYICQLDSDDEYTPNTLEKMIGHMESHPKCGLSISYYELMDENRGQISDVAPVTHSGYSRNQILRRDGGGALRVFPKCVLEEMGLYDEENFGNFGEDYDMVLKVGEKYDVDRVHEVLYRYRRHSDNTDITRDPLMKVQNKNNARLNALRRRTVLNTAIKRA